MSHAQCHQYGVCCVCIHPSLYSCTDPFHILLSVKYFAVVFSTEVYDVKHARYSFQERTQLPVHSVFPSQEQTIIISIYKLCHVTKWRTHLIIAPQLQIVFKMWPVCVYVFQVPQTKLLAWAARPCTPDLTVVWQHVLYAAWTWAHYITSPRWHH